MIGSVNKIFEEVYKDLRPADSELRSVRMIVSDVISGIKTRSLKADYGVADIRPGGSYAKGTWISGESDIDIFVTFRDENSTKNLKKLVPADFLVEFGTREYFVGKVKGYAVQIVPLVSFSDITKVTNSMDFSLMHADYFNSKADAAIRKHAMLLKRFCKANDCFGSETYIHGFSGYVLELLTINYGGLEKLFDEACDWKPGKFIDNERLYYSKEEAIANIGANDNPLVLVDPTNRYRNVCGSLNLDNFSRFIFSARSFIDSPSRSFFVIKDGKKTILSRSRARGTRLFTNSARVNGPKTVFFAKYNKALSSLLSELKSNGITVYDSHSLYKEDHVETFIEIGNVPSTRTSIHYGPSLWVDKKNVEAFIKAHKGTYLHGDVLAYDKAYQIKDFNGFISKKIKEFISQKSILEE